MRRDQHFVFEFARQHQLAIRERSILKRAVDTDLVFALRQRVELALKLRELDVDSVPLNFLNPIPGTPLENQEPLPALDILKTIAMFRFILPRKEIRVCGGREKNLRDLQSWMFFAGASGTMIGNYLTTSGRNTEDDWQMLRDLELETEGCCG